MERDGEYWQGMSESVERGEYTAVGPVELGPAAPLRLSRITLYTPGVVLDHVAAAYAAVLNTEPVTGEDERGRFVAVTDATGFTIELRPVEPGEGTPSPGSSSVVPPPQSLLSGCTPRPAMSNGTCSAGSGTRSRATASGWSARARTSQLRRRRTSARQSSEANSRTRSSA